MNVNWGLFVLLFSLFVLLNFFSLYVIPIFFLIGVVVVLFDKYRKEGLAFLLSSGLGILIWLVLYFFLNDHTMHIRTLP